MRNTVWNGGSVEWTLTVNECINKSWDLEVATQQSRILAMFTHGRSWVRCFKTQHDFMWKGWEAVNKNRAKDMLLFRHVSVCQAGAPYLYYTVNTSGRLRESRSEQRGWGLNAIISAGVTLTVTFPASLIYGARKGHFTLEEGTRDTRVDGRRQQRGVKRSASGSLMMNLWQPRREKWGGVMWGWIIADLDVWCTWMPRVYMHCAAHKAARNMAWNFPWPFFFYFLISLLPGVCSCTRLIW